MAKRGFFAELQHQNQLAAKRRAQAEREAARAHAAATRNAERARRESERAAAQLARSRAAASKEAEREAKRLREEAQAAKVDALNAELAATNDQLDTVLLASLLEDDYVDLEALRRTVKHPPFPRKDLEVATPKPSPPLAPSEPEYVAPEAPAGLSGVFGGKKKHAEAVRVAQALHQREMEEWKQAYARLPELQRLQDEEWQRLETARLGRLRVARDAYESKCKENEREIREWNDRLDVLIAGLANGDPNAVSEYVGIVLGNSVYPERMNVEHEFEFSSELKELELTVLIAPPTCLPTTKVFRYVKSKDEISSGDASKKELKDRFASMVAQTALRSLHEVFEADRSGQVRTIAVIVATEASNPATGRHERIPLAAVGADRDSFLEFDLVNVVPDATLKHLGASLSKNPYDLVAIDSAPGVRGR